jgi:hypothetical protein
VSNEFAAFDTQRVDADQSVLSAFKANFCQYMTAPARRLCHSASPGSHVAAMSRQL